MGAQSETLSRNIHVLGGQTAVVINIHPYLFILGARDYYKHITRSRPAKHFAYKLIVPYNREPPRLAVPGAGRLHSAPKDRLNISIGNRTGAEAFGRISRHYNIGSTYYFCLPVQ